MVVTVANLLCLTDDDGSSTASKKRDRNIATEPWMTPEILSKMKERDRLSKEKNRRDEFKKIRNEVIKDCRKAQINYIASFGKVTQTPVSSETTSGNIIMKVSEKSRHR